uniref:CTCK domain-containing protein n=1 Tax=Macrostomum lignano TaxID=282301 RepID=A0A1I8FNY7_9PLAT
MHRRLPAQAGPAEVCAPSPRNSDYLPTKACQGPSVKYELCSSTRSCDSLCPSGQRYNEFGDGQPRTAAAQRCPEQLGLRLRARLVKRGDSWRAQKSECYIVLQRQYYSLLADGGYSVDLAACQIVTLRQGRTSAVPLSVDQMPACSLEDERIPISPAKDPNRCCYRASASACSREEVSISKLDDSCLLTSANPGAALPRPASPLIAPRRSDVVAAEVAAADSSQVYLLKLPGAHCTGCLPDRVQYSPTTLTVKCKSGESRQLRMPIVGACHCKQVPCPST